MTQITTYLITPPSQRNQKTCSVSRSSHLSSNVLPEALDAGHPSHPLYEVHRHPIQQASVPRLAGQAHMQLMQVILAGISPLPPQDLARLCQTNGRLHAAWRLECHVDGVWLPITAQILRCSELDRVRYGPALGKGGGVGEGSMG